VGRVDDGQEISGYFTKLGSVPRWRLTMKDGSEKPLPFREVANKVLHSSRLEWDFCEDSDPLLICHTRDKENWIHAEINLVAFAAVCGTIMS